MDMTSHDAVDIFFVDQSERAWRPVWQSCIARQAIWRAIALGGKSPNEVLCFS
jgi:hypothetical protein